MTTPLQYYEAIGKRKTAIARVRLFPRGQGKVTVNGGDLPRYFPHGLADVVLSPLRLTHLEKQFDVSLMLMGGGVRGQAEAARHGISRALLLIDPELRLTLKHAGMLRRDPRAKERKKPGLHRARRGHQFSKR